MAPLGRRIELLQKPIIVVGLSLLMTIAALGISLAAEGDLILLVKLTGIDFAPGDSFRFSTLEINNTTDTIVFNRFIVLDCWGSYFFWPDWGQSLTYTKEIRVPAVPTTAEYLNFIWPEGVGDASGLLFWAIATVEGTLDDVLAIDNQVFGYHENPTPLPSTTPSPVPSVTMTPTPDHTNHTFNLNGNSPELDTGIYVNAGQLIEFSAYGQICFHSSVCDQTMVGPEGYAEQCHEAECTTHPYDPTFHHGALIGRISNPDYFLVGDYHALIADSSGTIKLAINDADLLDNDGAFWGEIIVHR